MKKKIIIKLLLLLFLFQTLNLKSESIGFSKNKNSLELYKFGLGKNIIFIVSGINEKDINSSKALLLLINLLKEKKIKIPADKAVWIIPELNPDIFNNKNPNLTTVNINRNFPTDNWKNKYFYISSILSAGEEPFSEPESKTLQKLFSTFDNSTTPVIIELHGKDTIIIPGAISDLNIKLIKQLNNVLKIKMSFFGNNLSGSLISWTSNKLKYPSFILSYNQKPEEQLPELEKALNFILTKNFKEEFYKNEKDNKNSIEKKLNTEELIPLLYSSLPEKVITKLTASENIEEFINLFSSLDEDEELLLLVNKKHYLSPEYKPLDLVQINGNFQTTKKNLFLRKIILSDLTNMFTASKQDKANLRIVSGFRSFEEQKDTFSHWEKTLGLEEAKRVSAYPGASQHQLGTAIDFNSLEFNFINTKEGVWLKNNAYKYGFILSFPEGMEELTGYRYEPWHYRYIGKNASLLVYKYFDNLLEVFLNWYWETKYNLQ